MILATEPADDELLLVVAEMRRWVREARRTRRSRHRTAFASTIRRAVAQPEERGTLPEHGHFPIPNR